MAVRMRREIHLYNMRLCLATGIHFSIYIVELGSFDTFHKVFFMREGNLANSGNIFAKHLKSWPDYKTGADRVCREATVRTTDPALCQTRQGSVGLDPGKV